LKANSGKLFRGRDPAGRRCPTCLSYDGLTTTDLTASANIFRVTVTPNGLAASLEVAPSGPDDAVVSVETALAHLADFGIKCGVDAEDVGRALAERGTAVVVAQGRPPRDGLDGRLEIDPKLLEIGGRPRVQDDGQVDLFDLNLIHTVSEGQVLAKRIPPIPGEPGVTVHGQILKAYKGLRPPGAAGRGARLSEDGLEIVAALAGHAVVVGDQIGVSSIYQVRGDVGVATGHIAFVGSVVVRGDVRPGFHVKADGDVEIHGNVNGGTIEAGGNVSVRYGILGQGRVVAAGTARAKFVEYAEVCAGAEVWVSDGIVQSKVVAGTTIEVLGRYGSVLGGHVFARKSLTARQLGSPGAVATTIAVGAAPELIPEAKKLAAQQAELVRKIPALETRLKYFHEQAAAGRLNRRGAQELEASEAELQGLVAESKRVAAREKEIAEMLADLTVAFVDARDACHAEVSVVIGPNTLLVRQAIRGVRFRQARALPKIEMISLDDVPG
jgi:uncharacterized protein (DUF342 family)